MNVLGKLHIRTFTFAHVALIPFFSGQSEFASNSERLFYQRLIGLVLHLHCNRATANRSNHDGQALSISVSPLFYTILILFLDPWVPSSWWFSLSPSLALVALQSGSPCLKSVVNSKRWIHKYKTCYGVAYLLHKVSELLHGKTSYGFQNHGKHENENDWDDFQFYIVCPAYVYMYYILVYHHVYAWLCTERYSSLLHRVFTSKSRRWQFTDPPV